MREILFEEFMGPMHISACKPADDIRVPVSRIHDILHGRRKITAGISPRLSSYFGVSDSCFLSLQNDIGLRNARIEMEAEISRIIPLSFNATSSAG